VRKDLKEIIARYESYHPKPRSFLIKSAFNLAEIAYFGEKRLNGEPWINHAVRVSEYLLELGMDAVTLSAGLLHDSFDFGLTSDEIRKEVGPDVADLLINLTNLKEVRGKGIKNYPLGEKMSILEGLFYPLPRMLGL